MSARGTWNQARKAIRDAQTSLTHADERSGRGADPAYDAEVMKARLALAAALRALRAAQRAKGRAA